MQHTRHKITIAVLLLVVAPLLKAELRLASLAPHITELVYFSQAEDLLIAVDRFSNYPKEAKSKKVVGDAFNINTEMLLEENITHVLYWQEGTPREQLAAIKEYAIKLVPISITKITDIPTAIEKITKLTGKNKTEKIKAIKTRIEALKTKDPKTKVPVFYQISEQPIYTVNKQHIVSNVINHCGGKNVFGEEKLISPVVSLESVITSGAELIISSKRYRYKEKYWQLLPAVRQQQILTIEADILTRPSVRFITAAEKICAQIKTLNAIPTPQNIPRFFISESSGDK